MNGAPKYAKIELLLRDKTAAGDGLLGGDADFPSVRKKEFTDCGMAITGDHLLIIETETVEETVTTGMDREGNEVELQEPYIRQIPVSSTGHIYSLSEVVNYRTINNQK